MHKLGIIVPYRNRPDQLKLFQDSIKSYIKGIDYELIIVDQQDDNDFNRGKLLNIGFVKAQNLGCDYVVFHDIDMLPIDVDYSYSDTVLHLVDKLETPAGFDRDNFDEYFGGVTLFPVNIFEKINGYSNEYWGWGFEDDNLMLRCQQANVKLDRKLVVQSERNGVKLKFNGTNSYVACPNVFNSIRDFSIYVNFSIDKIQTKVDNITDINSVFSIPGFDTTLTYNSFRNFSFQFWKKDLSSMNLHSDHYPEGTYSAIINVENKANPKKVSFWLNGQLVGSLTYDKLRNLKTAKYFYLGVGDPEREEKQNWMDGGINVFAAFKGALSDTHIKRISNNIDFSLFNLDTPPLSVYYDGKFLRGNTLIDLSENRNDGIAFNCSSQLTRLSKEKYVFIPKRRKGTLKGLKHDENGYTEGYWKSWQSRINQLDYLSKYYDKDSNYKNEGLSTLYYSTVSEDVEGNIHHLKVNLT